MSKNTTDLRKQLAEYGAVFVADTVTIMPDKLEQLISDRERLARIDQIDRIEDYVNAREKYTKDVDAYRAKIAMERMHLSRKEQTDE